MRGVDPNKTLLLLLVLFPTSYDARRIAVSAREATLSERIYGLEAEIEVVKHGKVEGFARYRLAG